jgi:salicylate hydroxylase
MMLIDPAINDGYEKHAAGNSWKEKKETWFDFRIGMKNWIDVDPPGKEDQMIANVRAGDVGQSAVHRAHFLDELVKLIPDGVAKFGKRLEELEVQGEKMKMFFNDGSSAVADAVIGCDGIKSRTRQILLGKHHEAATPKFSGKVAYRGLINMGKAVEILGEEKARNSQMYLGHHGHVLTLPVEKGATINVVAFQTKRDGKWEDERWVLPIKKEDMLKNWEGWGDSVIGIMSVSSHSLGDKY